MLLRTIKNEPITWPQLAAQLDVPMDVLLMWIGHDWPELADIVAAPLLKR